ncbi:MAG TPA: hypothetical protein VME40_04745, partial [Caulobacteraceae bacterium]|nr:hypothetical protein [Caulobacteraceae bacterium]
MGRDPPFADVGVPIGDLIALGGAGVEVVEFGEGSSASPGSASGVVRIGVHRTGPPLEGGVERFDILLSADPAAPGPWVGLAGVALDEALEALKRRIEAQPIAASVVAQVLRTSTALSFDSALWVESLAYSMLLASEGFRAWRAATPRHERDGDDGPRVSVEELGGVLQIRLTRPAARNAFDARMRDEVVE